ncbi:ATP-binding protein [Pelagicoccus sp. SDUM812003]|uniref:sensor histidine kinase n=1 Tax=Pelagicoccus sp. SDUM812003 TaxID=3041267 RepID=UPI00280FDE72|nr:ATP-binding protein [Pelagicoccus sp. SDUM812003]MDQ8202999.1 ATP-binding protein [Pelagicoccus sp. SDUM812003]
MSEENESLLAKHIGSIALMQSVVVQLPSLKSILQFVERGFSDLPSVVKVVGQVAPASESEPDSASAHFQDFPISFLQTDYATLRIFYRDPKAFHPYLPYIQNFVSILGVVCEERRQRELNQKLLRTLEQKVEERTRELNESLIEIKKMNTDLEIARSKAEESDRLKSAFLANISHEIRTPMNGILGFAQLLSGPNLSEKERCEFRDLIQASGNRLLTIINDLLDISKIEANQVDFFPRDFSLNKLMQEMLALFREKASRKGVILSASRTREDQRDIVTLDRDRIAQIYSNLIDNALKFTDTGQIQFGYRIREGELNGFVHDTGIGVHESEIENVFKRFRQGTMERNRLHDGSGLGLSICKSLVELQGGSIRMRSKIGRGTQMEFVIPIADRDEDPLPKPRLHAGRSPRYRD